MESELDRHIVEFAQLLRQFGIKVSASEILDAMEGLIIVGMDEKDRVKAVLQATLIKDAKYLPWFEEAFRTYFAPPEQQDEWQKKAGEHAAKWEEKMGRSKEELRFQGRELEISEEHRVIYAQMPETEQQRLKEFLEKSSQGVKGGATVDQSFQPMIERVVRGSLEYWRRKLDEEVPLSPPGSGDGVMSEVERAMREKELKYFTKDLKKISPEDWPEVIKLIRRLSRRLANQISRRYRSSRRRGGVDIRKTLRRNLRYGGVLVERRYRRRHSGRPRFVLLCDLSGSMLKYTEFVLQFLYGLSSVVEGIETFAFADHLVRLTDKIQRGQSFEHLMESALPAAEKEWGGGTNLAVSLESLVKGYKSTLSRRTVFIVLSDTQTLEGERAAELLKGIRHQVREVIWLNTLPARRWAETQTVELFKPHCQMYECYTLSHLTAVLSARL